jgi:hypothetical protein
VHDGFALILIPAVNTSSPRKKLDARNNSLPPNQMTADVPFVQKLLCRSLLFSKTIQKNI